MRTVIIKPRMLLSLIIILFFGDISNVTIDSQAMVKIPKFYAKQGTVAAGADQAGKKAWWVSDQPVSGFFSGISVHGWRS